MRKMLIGFLCLLLASCGEQNIGKGYRYVRLDHWNHVIVDKNNDVVVLSDVTEFRVEGTTVVGLRVKPQKFIYIADKKDTSGFGFFILDLQNGRYVGGLSERQLKASRFGNMMPISAPSP